MLHGASSLPRWRPTNTIPVRVRVLVKPWVTRLSEKAFCEPAPPLRPVRSAQSFQPW